MLDEVHAAGNEITAGKSKCNIYPPDLLTPLEHFELNFMFARDALVLGGRIC